MCEHVDADIHGLTAWHALRRCPMHAFSLAICSMLGFPWAKTVVGTAQQLAIHFSTNPTAVEVLAAEARQLGQTAQLSPCSLSQVQSVHACLQSLLALQTAIKQAVAKCTGADAHFMVCVPFCSACAASCVRGHCLLLSPYVSVLQPCYFCSNQDSACHAIL